MILINMLSNKKGCQLIRAGTTFEGAQKLLYNVGISAESVGATGIHMQLCTIPPKARSKAHKHASHETAIYALSGESHVWYGERLENHCVVRPGDFFYIPANVPHLPFNTSETEPAVVLIARTDPNEQESVELLDELDVLRK